MLQKFLLLFFLIVIALDAKTYTVILPKEWKPYYYVEDDGIPKGFAIDLFEEIAKVSNIKYNYRVVETTKELYPPLINGEVHILPNLGISEHRKSFVTYSHMTDTSKLFFYKRFNSEHINDLTDVTKVATVKANIANRILAKEYKNLKIKVYSDHFSAIRDLLSGEIDVFCYPQPIMQYTLKNLNIEDKIIPFYKSLSETKRAIAISNKSKELVELINTGLKEVQSSGKYDEIYLKWFGKEKLLEFTEKEFLTIVFLIIMIIVLLVFIFFYVSNKNRWLVTKEQLEIEIKNKTTLLNKQNKIIYTQAKIASLGGMLRNIAHQWKQPLAAISMKVNTVKLSIELEEKPSDEELINCVETVSNHCQSLSKTIDDFKKFSSSEDKMETIQLENSILKAEMMVADSFKSNQVKIIKNIENCEMYIKENTLIQAIINILNNARDAILEDNIENENRFVFIDVSKCDTNVKILIKDSGGGIKDEIIGNIFEPYFTTKFKTQGKGAGLYMTYQMITEILDSKIEVENLIYEYDGKELKGAQFTITLAS